MNYEELLASRKDGKHNKTRLPIGDYYRQQIEGKYRSVVDVAQELNSNIKFSEALRRECEQNASLTNQHILHFRPQSEGRDIIRLEMEQGQYQPLQQVLNDNPSIVAEPHFIEEFTRQLLESAAYLHSQGVFGVCYSPQTVFLRKGDNAVMLSHVGSHYISMSDPSQLYHDGLEEYVAPEVMGKGTIDNRCDIYSIGRLLQKVFDQSDMPLELRKVVKRAVSESPEDRYGTPEEMLGSINRKRNTYRSLMTAIIAVAIAGLVIALYFDMMPESNPVEFVKPAPRQATDDLIDDGFNPEELGVMNDGDSLVAAEQKSQEEYQAKAEAIFRKRYTEEADKILSKIYNKDHMNASEKSFMSQSESTVDELMKAQQKISAESALDPARSQLIATEIIERLTEQKKNALGGTNSKGIQK
ncbi:MAG: protein kinase family protein [Paludibacteraceae bacterium]|nr:protein kinase family protein [Paludibacteraceae bacterium]MBQ8715183.1 protein kinase family protein [Prevotella sp.]